MSNSLPRVSVVISCFNYAHFLDECVGSVIAQTFSSWECVIVDDGSTDASPEVAAKWVSRDTRIRYARQQNGGPASARNRGLAQTSATYVQFLDADDRLAPEKLEWHVEYLDAHPDAGVVYGPVAFFRTEEPEKLLHSVGGRLSRPLMPKVSGNEPALKKLLHFNIMPPIAALARREVIERAGSFNGTVPPGHEDWDLWLRCAIVGCRFEYLESPPVAFYRTHPGGVSRSGKRMMRSLIAAASGFEDTRAAQSWTRHDTLPYVYEFALGVDAIDRGERLRGIRRMGRAMKNATVPLTKVRWGVYLVAALLLPRSLFMRFVSAPVPERLLESYRSVTSFFGVTKRDGRSA